MSGGIWATAAIGAVATACCLLAARDARRLKAKVGHDATVIVAFWLTVAGYMIGFTALRALHGLGFENLAPMFYLQTIGGALTLVSLAYIMVGVVAGHKWSRLGAEAGAAVAISILTLIFALGLDGPHHDAWSIEFVPSSAIARYAIGTFYVAAPVAMSALVIWVTARDGTKDIRLRSLMYSTAVMLIFVPNAIKYVVFVPGATSLALAVVMMCGTIIGWRSYHVG